MHREQSDSRFGGTRLRLITTCALLALIVGTWRSIPARHDVAHLALALGQRIDGEVDPAELAWAPSDGMLGDWLSGRWVVFLGKQRGEANRDVFRARVRLSPGGYPLSIGDAYNLTRTPLGDDHDLDVRGDLAAFVTRAYDQDQGVVLLELDGGGDTPPKLSDRFMAAVSRYQQTGSASGVRATRVAFDAPPDRMTLAWDGTALVMHPVRGTRPGGELRLDTRTHELEGDAHSASVLRATYAPKPLAHFAVDTVRAVSWVGPAPIAWLEDHVFGARDRFRRLWYATRHHDEDALKDDAAQPMSMKPGKVLDPSGLEGETMEWPPAPLESIWRNPEPGEGTWKEPNVEWLKHLEGAPVPFVTTYVRPDRERPYVKVLIVAMDMRQLELNMEAGSEDPKPLVGAPGTGRIPRDPQVFTRVAATFNGAFKTEHGEYGMVVDRRVLLPPKAGGATVATLADGRAAFGTWQPSEGLGGLPGIDGKEIVSLRQNLDPLVDGDAVNPSRRGLWGFTLPGTGTQTSRSAVGVTSDGHLLYAWGEDLSGPVLGHAMKIARAVYAIHLDMNPAHTALMFTNINDIKSRDYKAQLVDHEMGVWAERYILGAQKDFFYLTLRRPAPRPIAGAAFVPDKGTQPNPEWLPAVRRASLKEGAVDVSLIALAGDRTLVRVIPGAGEPATKNVQPGAIELTPVDAKRVLLSVSLGKASPHRIMGLSYVGKAITDLSVYPDRALLTVDETGQMAVSPMPEKRRMPRGVTAVELPVLIEGGEVKPVAAKRGDVRGRAALGQTADGELLIARAHAPSDREVALALKRAGCRIAVALDRGDGEPGRLDRAGTSSPPRERYADTTLYVVAKPMRSRGMRVAPASAAR